MNRTIIGSMAFGATVMLAGCGAKARRLTLGDDRRPGADRLCP